MSGTAKKKVKQSKKNKKTREDGEIVKRALRNLLLLNGPSSVLDVRAATVSTSCSKYLILMQPHIVAFLACIQLFSLCFSAVITK